MARIYRIAAVAALVAIASVVALLGGAYYAARQEQPYYEEALRAEPETLQRNGKELESRASVLYSDVKQVGQWRALFTDEQINGWLATQLVTILGGKTSDEMRDPRIATTPDELTLGFRSRTKGVESVISVSASVLVTEGGDIGIRFESARAGSLPLPVMAFAGQLAMLCSKAKLPVRWTYQNGHPTAIVAIASKTSSDNRDFFVDSIELRKGEMYVAGHTEAANRVSDDLRPRTKSKRSRKKDVAMNDYELRLTPNNDRAALEIARRPDETSGDDDSTNR
jgi:hypothetical protein